MRDNFLERSAAIPVKNTLISLLRVKIAKFALQVGQLIPEVFRWDEIFMRSYL